MQPPPLTRSGLSRTSGDSAKHPGIAIRDAASILSPRKQKQAKRDWSRDDCMREAAKCLSHGDDGAHRMFHKESLASLDATLKDFMHRQSCTQAQQAKGKSWPVLLSVHVLYETPHRQ